ncbi:methyl-accepting chemotaxis protein [Oribacterium sp. KHPX15]|uniref:methyl-accepting chemotaxis protein n=1 Tax=Oribacterium sp. KHPX15 TaxID=1855342 RepID=UPI00089B3697|nr:methyl-accepting chemotaxis protein [Oribacterium sp. KHPX15]SEA12901.1 methyl-accepting chemotaxis protein [Oribacterium sp. KHPX15]
MDNFMVAKNAGIKEKKLKVRKSPLFFCTVMFQISAINIVMLIAFMFVMRMLIGQMQQQTLNSRSMSQYVLSLSTEEAELKSDVMSLYDQAIGYVSAKADETRVALLPEIQSTRTIISEDISELKKQLDADSQAEALASLQEIQKQYDRLNVMIDESIAAIDQGNQDTAYDILFNRAELQKVAIFHSCKVIDEAVTAEADNSNLEMMLMLKNGIEAAIRGTGLFILLIVFNFLLNYFGIVRKIKNISREVSDIIGKIEKGEGDLTTRIYTRSASELVYIINGINLFIETLQNVMKEVKSGVEVLNTSTETVTMKLNKSNGNVQSTSAAMEELSASMQSVSEMVSSINDQVMEVKASTDEINREATGGRETASGIKLEADEIKQHVTERKQGMSVKVSELSEVLAKSLEDSKKVKEINTLTKNILDIAEKTNLIAVNASIEAARAGQAGKSFAVVASEVSNLAANSKKTANDIQSISKDVTSAVEELASNAQMVLDFIKTDVTKDYDSFVETGNKYENTADTMNTMLVTFKDKADYLNGIMSDMANSVSSITNSVSESSQAITLSAQNTMEIVGDMSGISEAMDHNVEVTGKLNAATRKFVEV